MPWRPGPTPVNADVWLTNVTDGNSATDPPRSAQPRLSSRVTFGSSPAAASAYNELELQPSHNNPTTCRAPGTARSTSAAPSMSDSEPSGTPASQASVGPTSTTRAANDNIPRAVTPAPERMSGARDCTTLSEPCSPRCPPCPGQWCLPVCTTAMSGACSAANNDASRSYAKGYALSAFAGDTSASSTDNGVKANGSWLATGLRPCNTSTAPGVSRAAPSALATTMPSRSTYASRSMT